MASWVAVMNSFTLLDCTLTCQWNFHFRRILYQTLLSPLSYQTSPARIFYEPFRLYIHYHQSDTNKIKKVPFVWFLFSAEVLYCSKSWKQNFGQDSKADFWTTCDMTQKPFFWWKYATLGSIVLLAMFLRMFCQKFVQSPQLFFASICFILYGSVSLGR